MIINVAVFAAGVLTGIAAVAFYQIFGKPVMPTDPEIDMRFDEPGNKPDGWFDWMGRVTYPLEEDSLSDETQPIEIHETPKPYQVKKWGDYMG